MNHPKGNTGEDGGRDDKTNMSHVALSAYPKTTSAKSKKNLIDLSDLDLICPDLDILTPLSNLSKIGTKVIKPCKCTKIVKEMSKYTK